MLIHDFVCVEVPVPTVVSLIESGDQWLLPLALSAYREGEALLLRAGPAKGHLLTKRVRMTVGQTRTRGDSLLVPIRWEATGLPGLFPVLDADLDFAPLGGGATQISLWGSYDPPLDGVGMRLDRLVFHRVAEATVRAFLSGVAEAIRNATAGNRVVVFPGLTTA